MVILLALSRGLQHTYPAFQLLDIVMEKTYPASKGLPIFGIIVGIGLCAASIYHMGEASAFVLVVGLPMLLYFVWLRPKMVHDLRLRNDGIYYELLTVQIGVNFVPWHAMDDVRPLPRLGQPYDLLITLKDCPFRESLRITRGHEQIYGRGFFLSQFFIQADLVKVQADIHAEIYNNSHK
jgi:hypothetical protein